MKGYDTLLNIVLDDTIEYLRGNIINNYLLTGEFIHCITLYVIDSDDTYKVTDDTRHLGLVVCRGTTIIAICPVDGMESIANPFIQHE